MSSIVLQEVVVGQIPEEDRSLMIEAFVNDSGQWCMEKFEHLLPSEVVMEIVAVMVVPSHDMEDSTCWAGTSNGSFSTKSAYELVAAGRVETNLDVLQEIIWRWNGIEIVKYFLWQGAREGFLTNGYTTAHHMGTSSLCPICGLCEESFTCSSGMLLCPSSLECVS